MTPPRPILLVGWALHRALFRASHGRIGTARPTATEPGTLFLTTRGRKSGKPRRVGLYYIEEGSAYAVVASNAGADRHPTWWLNLEADARATMSIGGREFPVTARRANPREVAYLWPRLVAVNPEYERYRTKTEREIPIVILAPTGPG